MQSSPRSAALADAGEKLAPYYPTPETIVDRMLELGQLKPGEKMFDLGSGDGRIVIMAAQKYHADATGVELDFDLVESSQAKIRQLGLQDTARIIYGDILKQNYSSANLHHRVSSSRIQHQSAPGSGGNVEEGNAHRGSRFRSRRLDTG